MPWLSGVRLSAQSKNPPGTPISNAPVKGNTLDAGNRWSDCYAGIWNESVLDLAVSSIIVPNGTRLLTTLREKLIKIGAKVVQHARYVVFQLAEVAVPRALFARILERIQWFGVPAPLVEGG